MSLSGKPVAIVVEAPARLHLGFIDLHGGLGRRFGSLGLALSAPATRIRLARSDLDRASGPDAGRAARHLALLRDTLGVHTPFALSVEQAIPPHAGLGSGTQMALAVATAFARAHRFALTPSQTAAMLERGARSGVGIAAFEQGGLAVDGGRGATTVVPPVIARLPFPERWRVLLVFDRSARGLHGADEVRAFRALPPFAEVLAAHLARVVLMQILPAAAEADLAAFGAGINALQAAVGDHFAPAQGGRYASAGVARSLDWLAAHGAACVGQSSWGPTGFAIVESAGEAERLARFVPCAPGIEVAVAAGRNAGAVVRTETLSEAEAIHG